MYALMSIYYLNTDNNWDSEQEFALYWALSQAPFMI